jgi:hypothetical protein
MRNNIGGGVQIALTFDDVEYRWERGYGNGNERIGMGGNGNHKLIPAYL